MKADIATHIIISPQCTLSGALGVLDMLVTANYLAQRTPGLSTRFRPQLVAEGGAAIQGSCGLSLAPRSDLGDPAAVDIAIVASGPPAILGAVRMAEALAAQAGLARWLADAHAAGAQLASCCTGSFLLAAAGLLDGRLATTHWRAANTFRALYPQVGLRIDSLLVEDERLLTGGGAQSFSTVVLHLVEQHMGAAVAGATARLMLADGREAGQTAYQEWLPQREHGDSAIARAQDWLEQHLDTPFDLERCAASAHLTARTLLRRFKQATGLAPLQYQQRLRVEAAKRLLETSAAAVNRIVWEVGYEDVSSFQRLFRRETGLTMAEYRQRFGGRRYAGTRA